MLKTLVAGVLGVVMGFLIGSWQPWQGVRPQVPLSPSSTAPTAGNDRIYAALESLSGRLDALAKSPQEARRVPDAGEGASAAQLDGKIAALEKVIQELRETVKEALEDRARGYEEGVPPIPKNVSSLTTLCMEVASSPESLNAKHFLWTPLDVYRRYGKPDSVNESGAVTYWVYNAESTAGAKYSLIINFNAGYFLNARCESASDSR